MQEKDELLQNGFEQLRNEAYEVFNANGLLPDDVLICECFSVSAGDIRQYFSDKQLFTLDNLTKKFCMGTGCKSCFVNKKDWFNKIFE